MISNHETLAAAAVRFVGWKNVESMLPPCLQVDDNKRDRDYYSDIELVEGLDEEVENLPDV
uniref:Transcriptional regulator n=1 Tax=Angiostrongylus cantonensis TaxID=6313 RepID=A0A0K0D6Q3_ANGCA